MKFILGLLCGLVALASPAEDVSYLRRLRKLTNPAMIWTSKSLNYTVIEDHDVTDIENILQELETAIEKRQKDAGQSPYLVIYSLDERTTTESFVEGRDSLDELPAFMKKGSTHLYPHCLARKKKPNTSQWAAILDSLENEIEDASEAKLVVLSDAEVPEVKSKGIKYLNHSMKNHHFDKILESMASARILVVEASLEFYPEGGYLHHIDHLVGSTEHDVILFMAVTSPLPEGAIHGLLPVKEKEKKNKRHETTELSSSEETEPVSASSVPDMQAVEGTGERWEESESTIDESSIDDHLRRRLQAVKVGDEEATVLRVKP